MTNLKGLTINAVDLTVTITRDFAKRMNDITSKEYKAIRQLRNDGFEIIKRTAKKKQDKMSHKGVDIPWMREYIKNNGNDEMLNSFDSIIVLNKTLHNGKASYFGPVKKAFFEMFPKLTAEAIREEIEAENATIALIEKNEESKETGREEQVA